MFSAPSLMQPHRSIPDRLTPSYQYSVLTGWVLMYQKETAKLVDKICREGLNSLQARNNHSLSLQKIQTSPYFAAEYLDLIEDSEGEFLIQRLEKISSWFLLHGLEHNVLGFRNLKSVVETSLTSLRSARDKFRSTRAPLNEKSSFMKLLGQVVFGGSAVEFDKTAYNQQVLGCIHEACLHVHVTDRDDTDSEGDEDFEKVDLDRSKSMSQVACEGVTATFRRKSLHQVSGRRLVDDSQDGLIQTEKEKLRPIFQYKVMKLAVTEFQGEISEIVNEICLKEVAVGQSEKLYLPFIAVEYLDLVLEPKGKCLLSQIEKITSWLVEHSIKHNLGFTNLKAVVEINLESAIKAKHTFRSLRAPKKEESSYMNSIMKYTLGKDSKLFDEDAYKQQVMEVLHSVRLQALDQDPQLQQDDESYKTFNLDGANVRVCEELKVNQADSSSNTHQAQLFLQSNFDSSLFRLGDGQGESLISERFSSDEDN